MAAKLLDFLSNTKLLDADFELYCRLKVMQSQRFMKRPPHWRKRFVNYIQSVTAFGL
jgi:hypothetical protein